MALAETMSRESSHSRDSARSYSNGHATGAVETIRVFVAAGHSMVRRGLAAVLAAERNMQWVGDAGHSTDALRSALAVRPQVVVIDQHLPGVDGIGVIEALRPLLPAARFVLMMGSPQAHDVRRAMAVGATSIVLESACSQELVNAIHAAHRGQSQQPPALAHVLAASAASEIGADLTPRERDLLGLMAQGLGNQEISSLLDIALPTVKFHVTNILRKLHVENRTTAVLVALRSKVVELG